MELNEQEEEEDVVEPVDLTSDSASTDTSTSYDATGSSSSFVSLLSVLKSPQRSEYEVNFYVQSSTNIFFLIMNNK